MNKCPECGSDQIGQSKMLDGPMWCENCGFRVEDKNDLPNPFFVETEADATGPSTPALRQGGLGWQVFMATQKKAAKRPSKATAARDAEGEEAEGRLAVPLKKDYLRFPESATVGQALRTCQERRSQWWWLLVTEIEGAYRVCSLGSLLPYLTGRTSHIVHRLGDCAFCSGLDPLLWRDSGALLKEALADEKICSRLLSELPLAELPAVEVEDIAQLNVSLVGHGSQGCAVTQNGVLRGVYVPQEMKALGGPPDF